MAYDMLSPIPADAITTTVQHRVRFHETDAMGIVHHANFVRLLEDGRIAFIAQHHRPYTEYIEQGLHFAVTRVDCRYQRPARFSDLIEIKTALLWVGGASICFRYAITKEGGLLVSALTEHALVRDNGRAGRIPADYFRSLRKLAIEAKKPSNA